MNETQIQRHIADHKATNKALLERVQARGGALDEAHTIDLTFISPTEHEAKRLILALRALGLTELKVTAVAASGIAGLVKGLFKRSPSPPNRWMVEGQLRASARKMADAAFTEQLVRLAAKYTSFYDGWGTHV